MIMTTTLHISSIVHFVVVVFSYFIYVHTINKKRTTNDNNRSSSYYSMTLSLIVLNQVHHYYYYYFDYTRIWCHFPVIGNNSDLSSVLFHFFLDTLYIYVAEHT